MKTQILNCSQKKPYYAPELDTISVSTEKTVLSGFDTEDWYKDPDEISWIHLIAILPISFHIPKTFLLNEHHAFISYGAARFSHAASCGASFPLMLEWNRPMGHGGRLRTDDHFGQPGRNENQQWWQQHTLVRGWRHFRDPLHDRRQYFLVFLVRFLRWQHVPRIGEQTVFFQRLVRRLSLCGREHCSQRNPSRFSGQTGAGRQQ